AVEVARLRVITWPTGRLRAVAPCSESARTMSRSDNMPARRPPAPRITTAPMRRAESNFAAAARSAVGSIETMSPPKFRCLAARIVFTFMAASYARSLFETRSCAKCPVSQGHAVSLGHEQRSRRAIGSVNTQFREVSYAPGNWLMRRWCSVIKLGQIRAPVEPGEQEQPGKKSPDMRLPGDWLLTAGHGK